MKKTKNNAFTLVELILVITILAILGTIAFISIQGYSKNARDSARINDISIIKKGLELYEIEHGKYPAPDDGINISYSGDILRTQGFIGDNVVKKLARNINKVPLDPLIKQRYIYSLSNNKKEYEILTLFESNNLGLNNLNNASAEDIIMIPKITGNYNGFYVKTNNYIVAVPSIINSELGEVELILNDTNIKSQVVSGGGNIPNIGDIKTGTGYITGLKLSVYNGEISSNISDNEKINVIQNIQNAYTDSEISNEDKISQILGLTTSEELINFYNTIFSDTKNNISTSTNNNPYTNCLNKGDTFSASTIYPGCDTNDIIICSGVGVGYTIAACNVGASIAGTDHTNENTIGYHFQWGRNDGFARNSGADPLYTTTLYPGTTNIEGGIDLSLDSTFSDTFIATSYEVYKGNWLSNTGTTEDPSWGQGPCDEGYIIPSSDDWLAITNAGEGVLWDSDGTTTEGSDFQNILKLPFSGIRYYFDGSAGYYGAYGRYWSSNTYSYYGYNQHIESNLISLSDSITRGEALSVRCFKN